MHVPSYLGPLTAVVYFFGLLCVVPLALSQSAQPAQVFFYPPLPQRPGSAAPTLDAAQANAVISHHLGEALDDKKTPENHGLWGHFMGWWQVEKRPRVIIVDGVDAQYVVPSSLKPTFYLDSDDTSVLDPYLRAAQDAVDRVMELPLVKNLLDTLDFAVEGASKALAQELAVFIALADSLWSSATEKWDAVALRLSSVAQGSPLWDQAARGVKAGIESMTQPGKGPVVLVVMPGASGRHYPRAVNASDKKRPAQWSSAFMLITGTSLLLVFAAAGAIVFLSSLGAESLPSSLNLVPAKS